MKEISNIYIYNIYLICIYNIFFTKLQINYTYKEEVIYIIYNNVKDSDLSYIINFSISIYFNISIF